MCHCTKNQVFHYGFLQQIWLNLQKTADLITFTEEIRNAKLPFLCSVHVFYFIYRVSSNDCLAWNEHHELISSQWNKRLTLTSAFSLASTTFLTKAHIRIISIVQQEIRQKVIEMTQWGLLKSSSLFQGLE